MPKLIPNKSYHQSGFTLLEILLVIGIIAILAGIVIVAINPGRQLATVRNTERKSDIKQISSAIQQYYIDENSYPISISTTLTEICDTGTGTTTHSVDCTGLIDLSPLISTYFVAVPKDPQATTTNGTGYYIMKNSTNKIILSSPSAELNQTITIGNIPVAEESIFVLPSITYNGSPLYIHPTDNSTGITWGCSGVAVGASSVTDGQANTLAFINNCAEENRAPRVCADLDYGGYDDWYLPASGQLFEMRNQKDTVNKGDYTSEWQDYLPQSRWWSSTENPNGPEYSAIDNYIGIWSGNYYILLSNKETAEYRVRCVRS